MTEDCKAQYQNNNFLGCIDLPFSQVPETQNDDCWNKCGQTGQKSCCMLECQLSVTEVYVDGQFSKENYLKGYEVYFNWGDMEEDDMKKWRPVLEKSYETCENLSEHPIISNKRKLNCSSYLCSACINRYNVL